MLTVYLATAVPLAVILAVVVGVLSYVAFPPKDAQAPPLFASLAPVRVATARLRASLDRRIMRVDTRDIDVGPGDAGHLDLLTLLAGDPDLHSQGAPLGDLARTPEADAAAQRAELALVRERMSAMAAQEGRAVRADVSWVVDGSAERGTAMLHDLSRVMLRAYDAEASALVRSLRTPRTGTTLERLEATRTSLERLTAAVPLRIDDDYHRLRVLEQQIMGDYVAARRREKGTEPVRVPRPRAIPRTPTSRADTPGRRPLA